jgi:hypothetical protein
MATADVCPADGWLAGDGNGTTRRRNRTFQAGGCPALPVLKTGPLRMRDRLIEQVPDEPKPHSSFEQHGFVLLHVAAGRAGHIGQFSEVHLYQTARAQK